MLQPRKESHAITRLFIATLISMGLCGMATAQDTYDMPPFTTTADEEATILILYTANCMSQLASNNPLPGGCVESPPGQCVCTPSNAQKRNFMSVHYLKDGFTKDRKALYETRGAEYRNCYPLLGKVDRDYCDSACGFFPLLP